MNLFGDNSPFIQGYLKGTLPKAKLHNNNPHPSHHSTDTFTTPAFFNKWDLGWFVTDETHVLATDGEVYWGLQQIRDHHHLLPIHLRLVESNTVGQKWVLLTGSPEFFKNSYFKVIDFNE